MDHLYEGFRSRRRQRPWLPTDRLSFPPPTAGFSTTTQVEQFDQYKQVIEKTSKMWRILQGCYIHYLTKIWSFVAKNNILRKFRIPSWNEPGKVNANKNGFKYRSFLDFFWRCHDALNQNFKKTLKLQKSENSCVSISNVVNIIDGVPTTLQEEGTDQPCINFFNHRCCGIYFLIEQTMTC